MFCGLSALALIFFVIEIIFTLQYQRTYKAKLVELKKKEDILKKELLKLDFRFRQLEDSISRIFFIYELTGKISPIMNKDAVLAIFKEELCALGDEIEEVSFLTQPRQKHVNYKLNTFPILFAGVKTTSVQVKKNLKPIVNALNLCLEKITLYEKLENLSIHDSLTGIYNRRYFNIRLEEEAKRAKKFAFEIALVMADIDHFKRINDTYGHLVGDVVLKQVAQIIRECIREIDFVARYGGEEFIIILQETVKEGALFVAERIRRTIAQQVIKAFDEAIQVTVSFGIVLFPQHTSYPELLVDIADKAMYKAKENGRNRVECF